MSLLEKLKGFKKRAPEEGEAEELPEMIAEPIKPTSRVKRQETTEETEFRAREKQDTNEVENAGVPSVNRNKRGNKLITILGFFFILGAATALIVAVNSDKPGTKKKKDASQEQISNNLPPILIPSAPPPIDITQAATPAPGAQVPAIKPGMPGVQPIPLHGNTPSVAGEMGPNGKPIPDWKDRKMGGGLLVSAKPGGEPAGAPPSPEPNTPTATAVPASNNNFGGGAKTELSAKLEATVLKGVSASLLPNRNYLITKGTTLDCVLETALDSTVPGLTTCRLTRDVYSDNGHVLLLDRGSQLVGEYQGGLKQGQVRLFVLWTRAKTPNGVIVSLNSPGTDALGRSGLEGWVDNHFLERFGAAILMSFIKDSVSALAGSGGGGGTTNVYGGTATGGEKIVEKILDSTVSIPPTIIKNQGDHIQVMVARDLDFSSVYGLQLVRK